MTVSRNFVLAAGGTGGHIIPAYALGAELMRRGHQLAPVSYTHLTLPTIVRLSILPIF